MDQQLFSSWKKYVKNLEEVLKAFNTQSILAVGASAFPRIMPAVFIPRRAYQIYCIKDSSDIELLRQYAFIFCMEERIPKVAAKVNSLSYLLKSFQFQKFLQNRKGPYKLFFTQVTQGLYSLLDDKKLPWIGNDPASFQSVAYEDTFQNVLKKLKIPNIPEWILPLPEFLEKKHERLFLHWRRPIICQTGEGNMPHAEFYVDTQESLEFAQAAFQNDPRFSGLLAVKLSPVIAGSVLSMVGCVTEQGVLTSRLHLQLAYQSEGEIAAGNVFTGYDFGFSNWSSDAETEAQMTTELIGERLAEKGYKGVFGITFLHDDAKGTLYPVECKPRYTSSLPLYSMMNLISGAPPVDFFTLAGYLGYHVDFNFEKVNEAWKRKTPASFIGIGTGGISKMRMNFPAGIYKYHPQERAVEYLRPGAFLHELQNDEEFIIIDTVPRQGQSVIQTVPRLFKFIFPVSIAEGSKKIKPLYGEIISNFAKKLRGEADDEGLD